jgi:hypothetical protein
MQQPTAVACYQNEDSTWAQETPQTHNTSMDTSANASDTVEFQIPESRSTSNEDWTWAEETQETRQTDYSTTMNTSTNISADMEAQIPEYQSTSEQDIFDLDTAANSTNHTEMYFPQTHHVNFFGVSVTHRTTATPATSLAIILSRKRGTLDWDTSVRKAIVC